MYIYIYNVKTKRNQHLYFLVFPPLVSLFFFKQQQYLYLFQPQPTTPNQQLQPPTTTKRQAEEASTEAAGKQSQEALEEARAQRLKEWRRFDDRRTVSNDVFRLRKKKPVGREISGMEKEIESTSQL